MLQLLVLPTVHKRFSIVAVGTSEGADGEAHAPRDAVRLKVRACALAGAVAIDRADFAVRGIGRISTRRRLTRGDWFSSRRGGWKKVESRSRDPESGKLERVGVRLADALAGAGLVVVGVGRARRARQGRAVGQVEGAVDHGGGVDFLVAAVDELAGAFAVLSC